MQRWRQQVPSLEAVAVAVAVAMAATWTIGARKPTFSRHQLLTDERV
jgi:hypothetical protein